ncbi:MAG: hypothetical protein WD512_08945, partial [Candidatus Paceibacterota bacterium]
MKLIGIHFIVATAIHLLGLIFLFGTVLVFPKFSWAMLSIYLAIIIPLSYLLFYYFTTRFRRIVSLIQIPIAGFASFAACGISYSWYEEFVESLDKSLEILISSTVAISLICLVKITIDFITIILGFEYRE